MRLRPEINLNTNTGAAGCSLNYYFIQNIVIIFLQKTK